MITKKIKCNFCEKEFTPKGIHTHTMRMHGTEEEKSKFWFRQYGPVSDDRKDIVEKRNRIEKYDHSPSICKQCNAIFTYERRHCSFCDTSCAAKFHMNNPSDNRLKANEKRKEVTFQRKTERKKLKEPRTPYSTLYQCKCNHCGFEWINRTQQKFCKDHSELYSHAGRAKYWFTFGISSYPDLFDGKIIKQYGMRSKDNPDGVTRDHRVSVQEAIIHGYNPYYIKHPINCELMLFRKNASKGTKSSITYEELIQLVDEYEMRRV